MARKNNLKESEVESNSMEVDKEGVEEKSLIDLPPSSSIPYLPFEITTQGWWLVLSDLHIPYHDKKAIALAVKEGQKHRLRGILLNGDILDSHELSSFDKDPTLPRYQQEIGCTKLFFLWLRDQFKKQRIIFKYGNHEERLDRYVNKRAEALAGLEAVQLHSLLGLKSFDMEWIDKRRVVKMNKLSLIHGHEYRPNVLTPVNPARGIFLRAKGSVMCGHWHQTSEHHEPTISGKPIGCWSTGCLCDLHPQYSPLNRWNLGFALVNLSRNEEYEVRNLRIMNGRVV